MAAKSRELEKAIRNYIADVTTAIPVQTVYLFGSYAKGTSSVNSDIDLCFFANGFDEKETLSTVAHLLGLARKYYSIACFEPHVFSTSDLTTDNPFVKEVITEGIKFSIPKAE